MLLAHKTGIQVGIEAKLSLNAKVLDQTLPAFNYDEQGPDYRAVLVPEDSLQNHLVGIAGHLGVTIIRLSTYSASTPMWYANPSLPDEKFTYGLADWHNWCPKRRCSLPDYVPDVVGGRAAPVQLSEWKIKAIRLLILLERHGYVSRRDMAALGISPSRWTAAYHGFLSPSAKGYVRNERTPDLKAQHPTIWPQIEADFPTWGAGFHPPEKTLLDRIAA